MKNFHLPKNFDAPKSRALRVLRVW